MSRIETKAEVTGSVWKIMATVGSRVAEGDTIMILESMKMEIPVLAEEGGTLVEIRVDEGMAVSEGDTVAIVQS